ncbi:hypothetical protein F0L68_27310 [Solihabitans fulvus]|uniref:Uncharacterized protein n=1 Tax=Solihabitans fulvus TaxID=1892852 RepID=A0A5B2WYB1_9PSEU|nr:hypothetical protein [Solihabitans fulvus]KAA2255904.1 hypothetical protein F0L68_27310 [Solihabitans fulvus]
MGTSDKPVYVSNGGPVGRTVVYTLLADLVIVGPVVLAVGIANQEQGGIVLVVGCVLSLLGIPFGVLMWRALARSARRLGRLREVGVAATAQVTSVDWDALGEGIVVLELRVSGSGFETFEALVKCNGKSGLVVGKQFRALVDPSGDEFTVEDRLVKAASSL